jgi:pilus assembly protein Flp/PilA
MHRTLARFWHDRSGVTAIEYGPIAAGISITIVAVVGTIGTQLNATYSGRVDPAQRMSGVGSERCL